MANDSGSSQGRAFDLYVPPLPNGHFKVHAIHGREALSKPYSIEVTVSSALLPEGDLERLVLGQAAIFVSRAGTAPRAIHGVIDRAWSDGLRDANEQTVQHRLRLVPRFALLRHTRASRIFQDKTVAEVVTQVLKEHGIKAAFQLAKPQVRRAYVTQFEESTLAFVERLLAEAGIFYTFVQPPTAFESLEDAATSALDALGTAGQIAGAVLKAGEALLDRESMFFADDAAAYPAMDDGSALSTLQNAAQEVGLPTEVGLGPLKIGVASPKLVFSHRGGMARAAADKVHDFRPRRAVRTNRAEFRDYDPDRPNLKLVARSPAGSAAIALKPDIKASVDPSKGVDVKASLDVGGDLVEIPLEEYRHDGPFHYPDWADAQAEPDRILLQKRRRASTADGTSGCHFLSAGARFTLDDHPIGALNGEYVVVQVEHRAREEGAETVYENAFECVASTLTFTPREKRGPRVHGALTASVTGPAGEEIWVDNLGRIQVKFHWDRAGGTDHTSCWIRCMQSWGGASWGTQFIPRVGMEVVVVFDGGDPDKPIVLGSLYNGTHPMPFPLPQQRTKSGFKTSSSPHATGHNELSFDDAAKAELVHLRAQRDLDVHVERNHARKVLGDETITVQGTRVVKAIRGIKTEVEGESSETVLGKANVEHKTRIDVVKGNLDQRVEDTRTTRVQGRDDLEVQEAADHRYLKDKKTRVVGNFTVVVGKNDAPRSLTLRAEGAMILSSEQGIEIEAKKGVKITCGKTSIRIGEDGIELQGDLVHAKTEKASLELGKDGLKMKTEKVHAELGKKLLVKTDQTSLSMDKEVKLDGQKILLNSPDQATDPAPKDPKPPTEIELVDDKGKPLANQKFVIELDDGSQRTGVTDKDGKAKVDLDSGGKIRFPELSDVTSG